MMSLCMFVWVQKHNFPADGMKKGLFCDIQSLWLIDGGSTFVEASMYYVVHCALVFPTVSLASIVRLGVTFPQHGHL